MPNNAVTMDMWQRFHGNSNIPNEWKFTKACGKYCISQGTNKRIPLQHGLKSAKVQGQKSEVLPDCKIQY